MLEALIVFSVFQEYLASYVGLIAYADEVLALCGLLRFFLCTKIRLDTKWYIVVVLFVMLLLLANGLIRRHYGSSLPVFLDIFLLLKNALILYLVHSKLSGINVKGLRSAVRLSVKILLAVFFLGLILHVSIGGIVDESFIRYGLNSYYIFSSNPGSFGNQVFLLALFLSIRRSRIQSNGALLYASLILLVSTLRIKALVLGVLLIFFLGINPERKSKYTYKSMVFMVLLIAAIGWNQFATYFSTSSIGEVAPRLRFVLDGVKLFKDNWFLGLGPGSYGSVVAKLYYSPIYVQLGYENFYGLNSKEPLFLVDTFWPMIFVQYGLVGVLLLYQLIIFFIKWLNGLRLSTQQLKVIVALLLSLMFSSIGSAIILGSLGLAHFLLIYKVVKSVG